MKLSAEKHEFALFVPNLSTIIHSVAIKHDFVIADEVLSHRLKHVLRLSSGQNCIFFDQHHSTVCTLQEFAGKKNVRCLLNEKKHNSSLSPEITFLLPLLKREDYEQALYSLTEIGVTNIQLVFTQKSRNIWSGAKDMERAQRIIIAAAEQSKNFSYPTLQEPIPLALVLKSRASIKIFFDPMGEPALSVMHNLSTQPLKNIMILIGPEGDLSHEEKKMVKDEDFIFCALTQTILRAVQAAVVGSGLIRALLR